MPLLYLFYRPLLDFNEAWDFFFLLSGQETVIYTAVEEEKEDKIGSIWPCCVCFWRSVELELEEGGEGEEGKEM